jgi:outer membrane protein insertion porin family
MTLQTLRFSAATLLAILLVFSGWGQSKPEVSFANPSVYTIAGITVGGAKYTDVQTIKLLSGLKEGDEIQIPGDKISTAIRNLWEQRLFSDIQIYLAEVRGKEAFLYIEVQEVPRLSFFRFEGVSKSEADNIKKDINIVRGMPVNDNLLANIKYLAEKYFVEKGFLNANIEVIPTKDEAMDNSVYLTITAQKNSRTKISHINIIGNEHLSDGKLRRAMKDTKKKRWWSIFKSSKFIPDTYKDDKKKFIAKYNKEGYRNAQILSDSLYKTGPKTVGIDLKVDEGSRFYFRNITIVGNTKYSSDTLMRILGIKPGDIYNEETLISRVQMSPAGTDISSLYQDDGYMTFYADPVEILIENDSIDIEIRIEEGRQFRINKISISGNAKTNDHVIFREIRTKPGDLFNRSDIIRTQRELAQLGYFDPAAFDVRTVPDIANGTVDLEYVLQEKPSDQIELSGGFGNRQVVGSLGVSFTNFSIKKVTQKGAWRPVPMGDGQRLMLRAQASGSFFQSYVASFTEPWFGGKKPNSLTVTLSHSVQAFGQKKIGGEINPNRQSLKVTGLTVGLGKRLQIPDDWFMMYNSVSLQNYDVNNFGRFFTFANGSSNNAAWNFILQRNSVYDPIFPRWGSIVKFSSALTPPFSLFSNKDFSTLSDAEKFKWVEYYKLKFTAEWNTPLSKDKKLVLNTKAGFGFLGAYNRTIGLSPFERFYLGGVFISGFNLDGREIINLRGYDDLSLAPETGAPIISKYSAELRYLVSPNPNATVYGLTFLEAGNTWMDFDRFNPFEVRRSAGAGLRIFLPMFGLLGLDYGWRLDDVPGKPNMPRGQFHFSLGMNIGDL